MLPKQTEVVVIGGGPTGLLLTAMLRQAGHDLLTLDKQAEGANPSRAAAALKCQRLTRSHHQEPVLLRPQSTPSTQRPSVDRTRRRSE
jgi:2-polyprenyl-6-methoxyphenol hydroxylase-like FAD-dependent oxidoreductase